MSGSCRDLRGGVPHWRSCTRSYGLPKVHSRCSPVNPLGLMSARAPMKLAAAASGSVSSDTSMAGPQAILDRYRAMLHEYRTHKAALGDWLSNIHAQHKRQPQLLDAEATGDAGLVSRFQQYLMVRKRLLAEIPLLRDQLTETLEQQQHQHQASSSNDYQQHRRPHSSSGGTRPRHGVVNANEATPVSKSQAVGQFFAAVNYRKQQSMRDSGSASAVQPEGLAEDAKVASHSNDMAVTAVLASATPAAVHSTSALGAAGSTSTSTSDSSVNVTQSGASNKDAAVSHLLESAANSSTNQSSSRAAAAALAALSYKKRKLNGSAADASDGSSNSTTQQQRRPLAVQLAESPPPPPGYVPAHSNSSSMSSSTESAVVLAAVETAKGDVYAGRQQRHLDHDVSLEATLQGVPGGLGSTGDAPMFAATITAQAYAATTATASDSEQSSSGSSIDAAAAADALLAAAAREAAANNAPVGQVVTAKFDVYSGRRRVLDPEAQLDDYFASLEQGHSTQLAAAAAAPAPVSSSAGSSSSKGDVTGINGSSSSSNSARQSKGQQHLAGLGGSSSSNGSDLLQELGLADIIPLPT